MGLIQIGACHDDWCTPGMTEAAPAPEPILLGGWVGVVPGCWCKYTAQDLPESGTSQLLTHTAYTFLFIPGPTSAGASLSEAPCRFWVTKILTD